MSLNVKVSGLFIEQHLVFLGNVKCQKVTRFYDRITRRAVAQKDEDNCIRIANVKAGEFVDFFKRGLVAAFTLSSEHKATQLQILHKFKSQRSSIEEMLN